MRVAGLMSGTSCDGIDVAVADISGHGLRLRADLRHYQTIPYPRPVRELLLRLANSNRREVVSVAELSQVNVLLGELLAQAVTKTCQRFHVAVHDVQLIGSHGHTFYHQPRRERMAGLQIASTLQLGEAAVIAERTGVPVVSNFRPRDLAAGGQGAPLVPYVDYLLFRDARLGRVLLNLGGIANVTVLPAGCTPRQVAGFDTGPGNMLIDAVVERGTRGRMKYDRDGHLARRGRVLETLLQELLRLPYFKHKPPKSTGRELFGEEFAHSFLRRAGRAKLEDRVRTATELTAQSIANSIRHFVLPKHSVNEVIAGGGGVRNDFLMERISELLPGIRVKPAREAGLPERAKEALAFAVLAYQTWHGRTATLPSATGARHPVVLGQITLGSPKETRLD